MKQAKRIADSITFGRLLLGITLAYLGFFRGPSALAYAVWIMIINWTGDCLDGPIARKSQPYYRTWIGDHDLEIDMAVSVGLLLYLAGSGYVPLIVVGIYLGVWTIIMVSVGIPRSLGMLFQAPTYAWFIWVAIHKDPSSGWFLPAWILAAIVLTWPRFPKEIVPGFVLGMRHAWSDRRQQSRRPMDKPLPQP